MLSYKNCLQLSYSNSLEHFLLQCSSKPIKFLSKWTLLNYFAILHPSDSLDYFLQFAHRKWWWRGIAGSGGGNSSLTSASNGNNNNQWWRHDNSLLWWWWYYEEIKLSWKVWIFYFHEVGKGKSTCHRWNHITMKRMNVMSKEI